ncbi:DMT family transporter [Nesterenkonia flava]|uniref:Multidrug DMT transporter permease n=1 Tax=Nesterenkonia flava TaxID=469799 RepID=A0ABU1FTJ0_9MICC|nr:DMT family transporter [Nesterenkonia flava]MDR5711984.1 multidrug DMT transporter permease [Nesterenkonia flava]
MSLFPGQESLQSLPLLGGLAVAIGGAVLMSLGAHYQHKGVGSLAVPGDDDGRSLTALSIRHLLGSRVWLFGTVLLCCAVLAQILALALAPLAVVQPLGVLALVVSTLLHARTHGVRTSRAAVYAMSLCVTGVVVFVMVAVAFTSNRPVTGQHSLTLSVMLGAVLAAALLVSLVLRRIRRVGVLYFVAAAGVIYGLVVTLAKSMISTFQTGSVDVSIVVHGLVLVAGTVVGGYFVQAAHAVGRPHIVVAGLTVIDPAVAVAVGLYLLGEGSELPAWGSAVFVVAGACAVYGVVELSRHQQGPPTEEAREKCPQRDEVPCPAR